MATIKLTVLSSKMIGSQYPILICISQKSKRAYIQTDFLLDGVEQFESGMVVYRKDASLLNKKIKFVFDGYKERFNSIDCSLLTAMQIKKILISKSGPSHISFIEFWIDRISEIRKDKRDSYAKMNEETLRLFIKSEGDLPIAAINTSVVEHFKKWMTLKGYAKGNIGLRLTHLKARINDLIKLGLLKTDVHPFAYTKIPAADPKECDLSLEEFILIRDTSVEGKRLNLGKDMLLLSFYLCGINLKDLLCVDLSGDVLSFERTKTKNSVITIPIHEEARKIIDKYYVSGKINLGYSYSYSNMQKYINLCMRLLQDHLGIKQRICFYSARKTFSQFSYELGIPDGVIDYCLGHSTRSKGIIRYYTRTKQSQAEIAVNRVIDYTQNPDRYKEYIEMRASIMIMR